MKILITGAMGQLGTELQRQLQAGKSVLGPMDARLLRAEVVPVDLSDGDLTKLPQSEALVQKHRPDVVINCAAFTNVDAAETEKDAAFAANILIPRNMAMACQKVGAKLIHLSTDYVFSGDDAKLLTEADTPAPKGVYGSTKYLGEQYVRQFCQKWFVVRTAWLYGRTGGNFVRTMLRLAAENDVVTVVDDQHGCPTNAEDLAYHLLKLAVTEEYGLYHCTGMGVCSWYDFAAEIARLAGSRGKIVPCTTAEFPRPAPRPTYAPLDNTMLRTTVGCQMRSWQDAIADFIKEIESEGKL